ncbi:hypothetical protein TSUD_412840 [Trifolium subterraneum]|uniref:Uncharacterized protein n=1 Tax=Trifolium subterraneum TaxID=3900 RepID=A0A2Z6PVS2_TRISU|nr:hypothetical protein TSUD_412840 [Trifolium subterraneum]
MRVTTSMFTSPESIIRFREGYSLYNGDGEDKLVIVETVRADELVTAVNGEEPHYFYMYANVIQTLNLWFPLTIFEDTILRLLNVAPSQFHPNSWAFVKGYELLCYALDLEPSLGVFFCFYHVKMKGTILTHLLSAHRDKEILEASSKVTRAEQAVSDAERTVTEIKKQWVDEVDCLMRTHKEALAEMRGAHGREIAELRKKHADEKASLRTKAVILEAEVTTLEVLRNNLIISLTQSRKDISELEEDVDELEETNTALKQSMDDKYVDGFWSSIEQVKILFPELDPDVLAQVDVMKRIKDGKLI